jgi:hypothetical protein
MKQTHVDGADSDPSVMSSSSAKVEVLSCWPSLGRCCAEGTTEAMNNWVQAMMIYSTERTEEVDALHGTEVYGAECSNQAGMEASLGKWPMRKLTLGPISVQACS